MLHGSLKEPTILRPVYLDISERSLGIAVGMATNMPPHNIKDAIDAICAYIDNNDIDIEELIKVKLRISYRWNDLRMIQWSTWIYLTGRT